MTFIFILLAFLLGAVGFATYQLSDAKRWRQTAAEAREENDASAPHSRKQGARR